jgi:hypothetical protein
LDSSPQLRHETSLGKNFSSKTFCKLSIRNLEYIFKASLQEEQIFAHRDIKVLLAKQRIQLKKSSKYRTKEDTAVLKITHSTETIQKFLPMLTSLSIARKIKNSCE